MTRGRRSYKQEKTHPYDIVVRNCFPTDPPGVTWTDGWREANKKGIKSKRTYAKVLRRLVESHYVLKKGRYLRQNPTLRLDYIQGLRLFADKPPWPATDFKLETFADPGVFREITGYLFNDTYRLYITMLNELVGISDKPAAKELIELFTTVEIQSLLISYALQIWENRSSVRINEALGGTTLKQMNSPIKWISRRPIRGWEKFAKEHR